MTWAIPLASRKCASVELYWNSMQENKSTVTNCHKAICCVSGFRYQARGSTLSDFAPSAVPSDLPGRWGCGLVGIQRPQM